MIGKKFVPHEVAVRNIHCLMGSGNHNILYFTPIHKGVANNTNKCYAISVMFENGIEDIAWVKEEYILNCELYEEKLIEVIHDGRKFKLDLNKARRLGLIK